MKHVSRHGLRRIFAIALATCAGGAHAGEFHNNHYHYRYVALDAAELPEGFLFFNPETIDGRGRIYGEAYQCTTEACNEILPYVAVYEGGAVTVLDPDQPGVVAVNAATEFGTVGGSVVTDLSTFSTQAALFHGHSVELLPRQPGEVTSFVTALNNWGTALVESYDGSSNLTYVLYSKTQTIPLDLGPTVTNPIINGLNDWGAMSGKEGTSDADALGFRFKPKTGETTLLHPVAPDPSAWGLGINDRGSVLGYSFVAGAKERIGVWDHRNRFNTYFVEGIPQTPTLSNRLVFNDSNLIVITLVSASESEIGTSYLVPRPGVRLDLASLTDDLPVEDGPLLYIVDMNNRGDIIGVGLLGDAFLLERERGSHDSRPTSRRDRRITPGSQERVQARRRKRTG